MIAIALALALIAQSNLPDEATSPLNPPPEERWFRANLSLGPTDQPCPADSPARGKVLRDTLFLKFHVDTTATFTEMQCGKVVKELELTPREAGLMRDLYTPANYAVAPKDKDEACTNLGPSDYEMSFRGDKAHIVFRCAPPPNLAPLVSSLRGMLVAQYAN
jgi:hypothetical protein